MPHGVAQRLLDDPEARLGSGPAAPPDPLSSALPGALAGALPGGGHGIIGMRERVSLLGGEFSAGPLPGYGFRVSARIPLPPSA